MQLLSLEKKANIIVADDQLSIAIGRYGQNVRLAGRLLGWELDIFSAAQWEEHLKEQQEGTAPESSDAGSKPADEPEPTQDAPAADEKPE